MPSAGNYVRASDIPGTLGYAEITASQAGITTEADITGLAVTVSVNSGRRIKITGYTPGILIDVLDERGSYRIKEGGTQLQEFRAVSRNTGFSTHGACPIWIGTPTAGSHTYKITAARISSSGNLTVLANANAPAFILVEDIGT
jgi:hypothetical protein